MTLLDIPEMYQIGVNGFLEWIFRCEKKLALTFFSFDSDTIGSGQLNTIAKNFESTTVTADFGLKISFDFYGFWVKQMRTDI